MQHRFGHAPGLAGCVNVAVVVTRDGACQMHLASALHFGMIANNRVKMVGDRRLPEGGWDSSVRGARDRVAGSRLCPN